MASKGLQQQQIAFKLLQLAVAVLLMGAWRNVAAETHKLKRNKIPTFEVFNYLAMPGANSTQGYNTVRCGGPATEQANNFGDTFCFDMPLLKEKDLGSEMLGRVQGTFVFTQLEGGRIFVTETFILNGTSLAFKGSFSAVGMENLSKTVSSKPITGGTDDYELAFGNAFTTPLNKKGVELDKFGNPTLWFKYQFVFDY